MLEASHASGRLAVELCSKGRSIQVITRASFHNAIVTLAAIGGSTNAVVHLLAIAGRLGSNSRWRTSTGSGPVSRCWSTCSRPAGT